MSINRNLPLDTNFADILSNVLPSTNPSATGVIGSKPGETNNNHSNGNGTAVSCNNNGLDALGYFTNSTTGLTDFSDMLRNTCVSPLDQTIMGGNFYGNQCTSTTPSSSIVTGGANTTSFGVQSFASAVGGSTDRSNSANSTTSHGSKFFEDQSKLSDGLLINNICGKGANGGLNFYENLDNILSFSTASGDEQRDAYSLFPSSLGMASKIPRQ